MKEKRYIAFKIFMGPKNSNLMDWIDLKRDMIFAKNGTNVESTRKGGKTTTNTSFNHKSN